MNYPNGKVVKDTLEYKMAAPNGELLGTGFSDIKENCIQAKACMYTVTPDSEFVIDYHPTIPEVIIVSPCSGHGFKHSAAIGEVVSKMALNKELTLDISNFRIDRFK